MIIHFGKRLFGRVDDVPDLLYVATLFWHIEYLPIVPLGSYVVLDGSENEDDFMGVRIAPQGKSILVGYVRSWAGITAIVASLLIGVALSILVTPGNVVLGIFLMVGITAGLCAVAAWVMFGPARHLFWAHGAFLTLTIAALVAYYVVVRLGQVGKRPEVLATLLLSCIFISNGALAIYSLTRLANRISYRKALWLADCLGIDREEVKKRFSDR